MIFTIFKIQQKKLKLQLLLGGQFIFNYFN